MLSRTADNLYWLARDMERADCLARIIDAAQRLSTMPRGAGPGTNEWESAVATAGCVQAFGAKYDAANLRTVTDFLAFSPDNPASIRNCVQFFY